MQVVNKVICSGVAVHAPYQDFTKYTFDVTSQYSNLSTLIHSNSSRICTSVITLIKCSSYTVAMWSVFFAQQGALNIILSNLQFWSRKFRQNIQNYKKPLNVKLTLKLHSKKNVIFFFSFKTVQMIFFEQLCILMY